MKETAVRTLKITSEAFSHNSHIPSIYTCDGENYNPPLRIDNIPDGTKSLALIVEDPDAPNRVFTHWVVWNLPVRHVIGENSSPEGIEGINSFNKHEYMGPCPPSGTHRYFFKFYALDTELHLERLSYKDALAIAMEGRIIGYGELIGLYEKKKSK